METPAPRRYEIDELLLLSKSPLVCKPEGLPPIEEWMGPAPAVRTQPTRPRTDGDALTNSTNHDDSAKGPTVTRRPLFESRHLARSSIPEDIILGPPKMSFVSSSSARTPSGKFDQDPLHASSVASPVFEEERGESPRFERFKFERGIRSGDKDRGDKDRGGDRGGDRGDLRGGDRIKRGFRDDTEGGGWTNVSRQPRKSFGAEDGDRFRRDRGEREKRDTPWDKDRPPKYDNFGRDRDRDRPKLKRDESSWLLDDNRDRGGNRDRDRDYYGDRDRDHRDNHRESHRYNNSRTEKDPEWMDSGPSNEDRTGDDKTARSMEQFQRWKEMMKANNGGPPDEKKRVEAVEAVEAVEETHQIPPPKEEVEEKPIKGQEIVIVEEYKAEYKTEPAPAPAPAVVENGVDRFFGFWSSTPGANKSATEQDTLGAIRQEPKTMAKSRFTSFFAPQEEAVVLPHVVEASKPSPKPPTPANESSSEDREGFQRILKILNGVSMGSNPESIPAPAPKISRPLQRSISPITANLMSPPPLSHQNRADPVSQRDPNTDFLMRLMHQSHQSQQHQAQAPPSVSPLHQHYGGPSQMPPPPPISTSPHNYHRAKNNPLSPVFDDPAITDYRRRDASPIYPRGPPLMEHGPPAGWQQQQQMSQPMPPQSLRQVAPPPGLARNQHHQGPPPPPPFLGPPPLGVNGPPMPFQLGPMPPNIPPNFGPPPPFFSMNGLNGPPPQMNGPPPPGYHMPFHHHHHEPHHGPPMGLHGLPFGFPHEGVKSPPHPHGPGNTRFSAESIHRQIR